MASDKINITRKLEYTNNDNARIDVHKKDLGVYENILLQIEKKNKGIGLFNGDKYCFCAETTDTMHQFVIDYLQEKIFEHQASFLFAIDNFYGKIGICIYKNNREILLDEQEIGIIWKILEECRQAIHFLPDSYCFQVDLNLPELEARFLDRAANIKELEEQISFIEELERSIKRPEIRDRKELYHEKSSLWN